MSKDVQVYLKPFGECPCGCGKSNKYQRRPYSDGSVHVIGCSPCKQCQGRRSKRTGGKAQRASRKRHGIGTSSIATGHEEYEASPIRREAKSGAQVKPLATAFRKARAQSDLSRALGDNRPFVLDATPEPEGKETITAFAHRSREDYINAVYALAILAGIIDENGDVA